MLDKQIQGVVKPQCKETKAHNENQNSSENATETNHLVHQEEPINQNEGPLKEHLESDSRVVPDSEEDETMGVTKVKEDWPNQLWEAIREAKDGSLTLKSAPLETVVERSQPEGYELESLYGEVGSQKSKESKTQSLKTLPSYIGKSEHGSVIQKLPFQRRLAAKELDTTNLRTLLTTPVHCTITLADLLKLRPEMWNELGQCLEKLGIRDNEKSSET